MITLQNSNPAGHMAQNSIKSQVIMLSPTTLPSLLLKETTQGALQALSIDLRHGLCIKCHILAHVHDTYTLKNVVENFNQ